MSCLCFYLLSPLKNATLAICGLIFLQRPFFFMHVSFSKSTLAKSIYIQHHSNSVCQTAGHNSLIHVYTMCFHQPLFTLFNKIIGENRLKQEQSYYSNKHNKYCFGNTSYRLSYLYAWTHGCKNTHICMCVNVPYIDTHIPCNDVALIYFLLLTY